MVPKRGVSTAKRIAGASWVRLGIQVDLTGILTAVPLNRPILPISVPQYVEACLALYTRHDQLITGQTVRRTIDSDASRSTNGPGHLHCSPWRQLVILNRYRQSVFDERRHVREVRCVKRGRPSVFVAEPPADKLDD